MRIQYFCVNVLRVIQISQSINEQGIFEHHIHVSVETLAVRVFLDQFVLDQNKNMEMQD